jgi:hypothetical protein
MTEKQPQIVESQNNRRCIDPPAPSYSRQSVQLYDSLGGVRTRMTIMKKGDIMNDGRVLLAAGAVGNDILPAGR